jgi:hypothetical protein
LTRFSAASQNAAVSTPASVMGTSTKSWSIQLSVLRRVPKRMACSARASGMV